jgi:hypothetical protein
MVVLVSRIKEFWVGSQREFKRFESTQSDEALAQAGEKLWNVFNMWVQQEVGHPVRNFGSLKKAVSELYSKGKSDVILTTFKNAYDLHKYFYRGWTEDVNEIVELYHETSNGLKLLGVVS